jgi:hypothetical protein
MWMTDDFLIYKRFVIVLTDLLSYQLTVPWQVIVLVLLTVAVALTAWLDNCMDT